MIRLLFALIVLGALGHFVRWVFSRRLRGNAIDASVSAPGGAGSAPVSATRRMVTSAAKSVLVGGAVALVLFVGKLIYVELTQSVPARSSAMDVPRPRA